MKKPPVLVITGIFLAVFTGNIFAEAPVFQPGLVLEAGGEVIPVVDNTHTCPSVGDWDSDGDADLLVGLAVEAPVFYFRNNPENDVPDYEMIGALEADGEVINGPHG